MAYYIPNISTSDSTNGIQVPSNANPAFKLLKSFIIYFLLIMVGVSKVNGATKTWSGGSGNWNTGTGWTPAGVPSASDDVVINSSGTVTLNTNGTCNNFTLNSGTFRVNNSTSYTLTIAGNYSQTGGTFDFNFGSSGNSYVYLSGNFNNVAGAGSITTSGTGAPNGNYIFNGVGIQTLYMPTVGSGTAIWVMYTINSGSTVKLLSNLTLFGSNSATFYGQMIVNGSLDLGTYTILDGSSLAGGTAITLNSGALLITANPGGVDGSFPSTYTTKTFNSGANYMFNGSVNQITGYGLTGAKNLTINNMGGVGNNTVTLSGNIPISGDLTISSGILDLSAFTANRSVAGGTLTCAGTLLLGGITGGQGNSNFPANFSTLTMNGGTVNFDNTTGGQTVYSNPVYNNLILGNTSGTQTAGGNLNVIGMLTTTASGTLNMGTNQLLGTLSTVTNSGTIQTQNTSSTPIPTGKAWGGTVQYNATTGSQTVVSATSYNNLTLSNTSGTNTAGGNLVINGALTTTAGGTLNMTAAYTLSGILTTITNNGTISTAVPTAINTFPIPSGKTWGGMINYAATAAQTALAGTYNNLTLSGAGAKTLQTGTTIQGNFTLNGTATTTAVEGLTVPGIFTIGLGTSFSAGAFTHNIAGNWVNNGTFNANTSTIILNGAAQSVTGVTTFNNLTLAGSGTKTFANNVTTLAGLNINNSVIANLGTGLIHTASALSLAGVGEPAGSFGGTGSGATYINTTYFAPSSGIINVTTKSCTSGSWTGLISTDWNTASNWCDGVVPIASTNVIINSGINQPVIGAAAVCNSITINAGASLTITGSNTLTVNGDWTNNGTFTPNTSTINLTGNNASNITGSATTTFNNLTVNKGTAATTVTSLSKAFSVGNNLTVTQGNLILLATDLDYRINNDLSVGVNATLTHSVNWSTNHLLSIGGSILIDGKFDYTAAIRSHVQMNGINNKTIRTGNSSLSILTLANTNGTITASGNVTVDDNFWAFFNALGGTFATGNYIVTAKSSLLNAGGTININGGTLNVTSGLQVGTSSSNGNVNLSSGTLNADAIIVGDGTRTSTFVQSGGTANISGNLVISLSSSYTCTNSPTINITGSLTNNGTFTPSTSTINMNGAAQTITGTSATTFNNLTLSGTGTKTVGFAITANGDLTVNNGITLSMSTYLLTLNGNLINNGTISGTTGGVSITGTATQNIGAFTTTGTVTMLKTSGIATLTGNINGAGLIVNGTGGTLNLGTATGHTFTSAAITAGTLIMGASNALPNTLPFNLGGGTLKTGATTGYSETVGALNVTANSTIALGTGSHALNFAASNSVGWTSGTWLTITGWTGGYNGTSGTAGKIYIGTSNSGLTSSQLGRILFYNGTNYYIAIQLSTGEVVPTNTVFTPTLTYTSPNTFVIGTAITPLTPTINITPTGYSVSPALPAGLGLNASTGVISGTPTGSASSSNYTVTVTTAMGNATFIIYITTRAANTFYSIVNGNWNMNTTWSNSSGGGAVGSGIYPLAGDAVNIEAGDNVTVTSNANCTSLTFTGNGATLTVNSSFTLAVIGTVTLNSANANYSNTITGAGNLMCNSFALGTNVSPNSNRTTIFTTNIANLIISGDLSLNSYYAWKNHTNNAIFNLSSGIVTVNGSVRSNNGDISNTSTFTMATGTQNGSLILGGATPFNPDNTGTTTITLSGTSTLVKYNYSGNQTVLSVDYNNLTLSGSGQKTMSGTSNISGVLSMEGSATAIGTVPGYGTAATLQYRGSAAQTTGVEFPANFSGSGGVIINNANGVTLNTNSTISSTLTLTNGKLTTTGHLLSVSNTSTSAISGGSTTTFINGPVKWTLPTNLASGSTYYFPVGKNSTYLPFTLVNPTTGSTTPLTAQVEAFDTGSGGSAGTGVTAISTNEYWKLSTNGSYTNSSVSISRPTAISPSTVIATSISASANTQYSNLGGTFDTYGVYGSNATTNATIQYFVFATGNVPSMNVTTNTLHGFSYSVGNGPSNELSFKVSGISLSGNITVTPSSPNYEISTVSGGVFQTTQLILTPVSRQVNSTIYVREKAGLVVGNYVSAITVASSTSQFTAQNINCYGTVAPVITVSGGGSYCEGDPISLTSSGVTNQYWTGPNNYYSILPNNTITGTTTDFTGTYTVTGSITSNNNLIVNGDFSQGDKKFFTSSYSYFTTKDMGEAKYAIVPHPSDVHSNFCSCGDHTSGSGNQMVINGATTANVIIWATTPAITVTPYTNYQFTYYLQTVVKGNDPAPSMLQLYANGIPAGPIYTANDTTGIWTLFRYNWYSDSNTSVNLSLVNQQTAQNGNDFALDDIVFQQVYTSSATVNVSVLSINTPASVSVSTSANPVNSGQSVTLTATPTNGGIAPTYQWSVGSGTPVTGPATFSYIPTNGDVVTCTMTSNSNCYSGDPVSSSVTIIVNTVKNLWIGTKSSNWGDAANWTAGFVPGTGDNVEFATTDNYTLQATNNLILDVDRTIGNLTNATINPIRQLIIPPARYLKVNGSIITPDADPSRNYIQAQPDDTQQNGTLIFNNDPAIPVYATVEMFAKGSFSATGATYNGNTYHYSWQYFGIPINKVSASPTFDGSYVRSWYEPGTNMTNHWIPLTNDSILKPLYGYELTQDNAKMIVFQGQLVNWECKSSRLGKTNGSAFPGQWALANPFTAAIDIKLIQWGNSTDMTGEVYLYNTGSYANWGNKNLNAGQYNVVTAGTAGTLDLPTQIPSMQGFLVQVTNPTTEAWVKIPYSAVVKNTNRQSTKGLFNTSSSQKVAIKIDVNGTSYSDKMWIFSDPTCSRNFDIGWDGTKMFGNALSPQLYAIEHDGLYQIDCVDDLNNTELGFQPGEDMTYTFTFTHTNIFTKYAGLFLVDLVENKTIDITESGTTYSFVAESSPVTVNRFKIVTRYIEKDASDTNTRIKVFCSGNTVFVQNLGSLNGDLVIYDMMGRYLKKASFGPFGVTAVQVGNITGAYVVNASTSNERVSKRLIIGK